MSEASASASLATFEPLCSPADGRWFTAEEISRPSRWRNRNLDGFGDAEQFQVFDGLLSSARASDDRGGPEGIDQEGFQFYGYCDGPPHAASAAYPPLERVINGWFA